MPRETHENRVWAVSSSNNYRTDRILNESSRVTNFVSLPNSLTETKNRRFDPIRNFYPLSRVFLKGSKI